MSCHNKSLTRAALGVVERRFRMNTTSTTSLFHTIAAAQPASTKRKDAATDQVHAFVDELLTFPEAEPEVVSPLRHAEPRPTPAHLHALRTLLGMKKEHVPLDPARPLALPGMPTGHAKAWSTLLDLAEQRPQGWTLVGGAMVHLHAWEHGETSERATKDADIVLDVRAYRSSLAEVTAALVADGYALDGVSAEGVGTRYRHTEVTEASLDVLVPEGLDATRYKTTDNFRTIAASGTVQALERSMRRQVVLGDRAGIIIRPDLYAALVAKAAAAQVETDARGQRHLQDFATLASLYARHRPAGELAERLTKTDRIRLNYALSKIPADSAIWATVEAGRDSRETLSRALSS